MKSASEKTVEEIISKISGQYETNYESARKILHKFVCMGKCNWYKTQSGQAGFNRLDLTEQQRKDISRTISQFMKGTSPDEAAYEIHCVLCPGHPRLKP